MAHHCSCTLFLVRESGRLALFLQGFHSGMSTAECLAWWMHTHTHTHLQTKAQQIASIHTQSQKHTHTSFLFLQQEKSWPWIFCNCWCLCYTSRAFDRVLEALTCLLNTGNSVPSLLLPVKRPYWQGRGGRMYTPDMKLTANWRNTRKVWEENRLWVWEGKVCELSRERQQSTCRLRLNLFHLFRLCFHPTVKNILGPNFWNVT